MNKVRLQEVMAKTSVAQSVCYWNHAGETIKKSLKKKSKEGGSKRGGKLGREVIRHYISDNLTVPSATGAANCFHREQRGNNVLLNESLSSRLWKTHMAFCSRIELDVLFNSNPKFLFSRLSAPAIVDTYAYVHTAPPQIFAAKDVWKDQVLELV